MIINLSPKQFKVINEAIRQELYRLEVIEDRRELTLIDSENLKLLRQVINRAGFLV